jgi:hypothetical protein
MKWILGTDGAWHVFSYAPGLVCGDQVPERVIGLPDLPGGQALVCSKCTNEWLAAQEAAITVAEADTRLLRSEIREFQGRLTDMEQWKDAAEMMTNAVALHGIEEIKRRLEGKP